MSHKATILIVDDEPDLREVLEEYFVSQGYVALCAEGAEAAKTLAARNAVDIALLDVAMPGEDGLSLARHLRERYPRLAIVMLTSAGTVVDRIVGLEIGAEKIRVGRCVLDLASHRLTDETGAEVAMSPLEFDLLKALAEQPNRPLSRERILNLSQKRDWDPFDRSVDLRVMRLRKKIEPDPEHPRYIRTVRNEGYIFVPDGS